MSSGGTTSRQALTSFGDMERGSGGAWPARKSATERNAGAGPGGVGSEASDAKRSSSAIRLSTDRPSEICEARCIVSLQGFQGRSHPASPAWPACEAARTVCEMTKASPHPSFSPGNASSLARQSNLRPPQLAPHPFSSHLPALEPALEGDPELARDPGPPPVAVELPGPDQSGGHPAGARGAHLALGDLAGRDDGRDGERGRESQVLEGV